MKNRIASLFLVFALLMSLCTFAVARDNRINVQSGGAERFTDVPASHWAYSYIDKVVGSGLFNGKTATTFEPSNAMTRSQFVMVMARMEGMSSLEGQYTQTKFPDVTPTRRAAGPIAWASAAEQGYVLGFGDGTFKPDSPITRGQFAALIHRYIVSKRYTKLHVVSPEPAQFTDASSVSSAFTADVEYARVHGLLTGYSDGTVRASNPITRAAIAAILARFLDLVSESGYTPLLDGPVDSGDSGDSGKTDSGKTDTTETPTEYANIKLTVSGGTHGTTKISSVLRDGKQVAADDVKAGDVVTISHKPDSGYKVTVKVKDGKNKTVKVKTSGNTSTFTMPKNMPVTVTVTYSKESSGGGGGGSSGGGGGGGGGSTTTTTYYLKVNANVNPEAGGKVYLAKTPPVASSVLPTEFKVSETFSRTTKTVSGYAVFVPNTGYEFDSATSTTPNVAFTEANYHKVTLKKSATSDETVEVTYVDITGVGTTSANTAATVNVTGNFKAATQTGDKTWTINAKDNKSAYFQLVKDTAPTAAVTADTQALSLAFGKVSASSASVYLAVTPRKDFGFADTTTLPTVNDASVVTLEAPATPTIADTLRVYKITKSAFADGANITNVEMSLSFNGTAIDYTYDVTVKSFLGTKELTDTDTTFPARAFADKAKATMKAAATGNDGVVTVTAPVSDAYGTGYQVESIAVNQVTDMNRKPIASKSIEYKPTKTGEPANEYTFDMPDGNVEVIVTYKTVPDEALTYSLEVKFVGSGSAALNVAGTTENVSGTNETKTITVKGPATKSEYVSLYPGRAGFNLPIYLTGTPVAGKGYKYDNKLEGAAVLPSGADVDDTYFVLKPGANTVTITFDEIVSYGYNLTIIGDGTVTGDFNGPFSHKGNKDNTPQTYSSGLIVDAPSTMTLIEPVVGSDLVAEKPMVNGQEQGYGTISLDNNTLTEIVVEIHKKDRVAYSFTVEVAGDTAGSVTVKPESGKIGNGYDDNTKQLTSQMSSDTISSGDKKTYYAYEDTVVTIVPATTDKVKVKSITTTPASTDVMTTAGYSFQLKAETTATVTFGTLDTYSVLLKAPYSSAGLRSESKKIAPTATVQDVLYSLNNGMMAQSATSAAGIENELGMTPTNLNKIVEYYLTHNVAQSKDGNAKVTGSDALKEMLTDAIQSNISTMVPSVVENKKAEVQGNDSMVKTPLETAMKAKQADYDNANPENATGAVKSAIVKALLDKDATLKAQFDAGEIKESDFEVKVKVTPIISTEKETAFDSTGKSVQKQLERFVSDYLSKIQVDPNYNYNALTPEITVTTVDVRGVPEITISAKVSTTTGWPQLDNSLKMSSYLDQLNVWVAVQITSVTLKGENITPTPLPAPELYSSSQFTSSDSMKNAVKAELDKVDTNVAKTWRDEFDKLLVGGKLSIDMGLVLKKDLLDQVVDEMLKAPMETLTGNDEHAPRISSLGDGAITKSAFMNLYRDFVVYNSGKADSLLTLKTKGAESTYPVIGKIVDKNLVLTPDFEKILRDGYYPASADQVPYEQLVDLVMALRDGISEDIRTNSKSGQTSQTVIAAMIENQIRSRRGTLKVVKWGTEKSVFSDVERKEISNLFAELLMNSETTQSMQEAWQKLEDSGYCSVEYNVPLDASKRAKLDGVIESFYGGLGQSLQKKLDVGFKVEQTLK